MAKNDKFADIAVNSLFSCREGLVVPQVRKPFARPLTAEKVAAPNKLFETQEDPRQALEQKMTQLQQTYRPFLQDMVPAPTSYRQKIDFTTFQWRIATERDSSDFLETLAGKGQWETVTIPHYRDPIGKAETIYRTTFQLDALPEAEQCAFLHFDGVDYIAHAYLNGKCIGSHEGFFAAFEFECTGNLVLGENTLVICVENDFIHMGNSLTFGGEEFTGDKLYAATGPGYDDWAVGWHHCPAGMGIFQPVWLDIRSRVFLSDMYVRPLCDANRAEIYVEVYNVDVKPVDIKLNFSVFGKNFEAEILPLLEVTPSSKRAVPLGDTVVDVEELIRPLPLYAEKGVNYYNITVDMGNFRYWSPEEPWLYRADCAVVLDGKTLDNRSCNFGMRSFTMDTESEKKGMLYLNGKKIRMRGANTMGYEQQDVMHGDYEQLIYDMLLAKACNMNYLRITQRPVQDVILDYCDALGIMVQTDLPLFGALRRNKFAEAVRQAEEMERHIRKHPCAVIISYINENAPNGRNKPHRNMSHEELKHFFDTADQLVRFWNPDRVIKHIEGDFDPPNTMTTLTDNHAYTFWYNGQGLDAGEFIKGDWVPTKPDWYYYCGEYGAEGLDPVGLMRRHYPAHWLPQTEEEEYNWSPDSIIGCQTGFAHYCFYETPHKLEDWVEQSLIHQCDAVKIMTEAFRRNADMVGFALHLFIDCFPAGWMKTIVDYERTPKPAFFVYQDALKPVIASLRSDRMTYFTDETLSTELWLCNDHPYAVENATVIYEVKLPDGNIYSGKLVQTIPGCDVAFAGDIQIPLSDADGQVQLNVAVLDAEGALLHKATAAYKVFQKQSYSASVALLSADGFAQELLEQLGIVPVSLEEADHILIDDYDVYDSRRVEIDTLVKAGKQAIFYLLPVGQYNLCGAKATVKTCSMGYMHFASRNTGHSLVEGFTPTDFKWWYSRSKDRITPILETTFQCPGMTPILLSGNTDDDGVWGPALAVAECSVGHGSVFLCQAILDDHVQDNPVANTFAKRLLSGK